MTILKIAPVLAVLAIAIVLNGCGPKAKEIAQKPRPVEVKTLTLQDPPRSARVPAVVGSWKTEEIGFEVGGRVEWVIEPSEDVVPRITDENNNPVLDENGQPIVTPTLIARLDRERFQLQLNTAKADVVRSIQSIAAAEFETNDIIPAQQKAADADLKRAEIELERSKRLFEQNAGAEADVDRDEAAFQNAKAQVTQLASQLEAKKAEIDSLKAAKAQAEQAAKDAQRSLDDCHLYSSFPGAISEIHVVPGSVVAAGNAIVTMQMMDPIQVELEVSAQVSRQLKQRQRLPVFIEPDIEKPLDGFLYFVDPVADPQTRTFTVTLLVENTRRANLRDKYPECATTEHPWHLNFDFLPGARKDRLYAPTNAIHKDDTGYYLWRVTNVTRSESLPQDGMLDVKKLRIKLNELRLPFLGNNWTFNEIEIEPGQDFDPDVNIIAGKLDSIENFDGSKIMVEKSLGKWSLRPGDLVQVDLTNPDSEKAIYVEMDAVFRSDGKSYLFLIDENQEGEKTVDRVEVNVVENEESGVSQMLRIEDKQDGDSNSLVGKQYVTKGTHYLRDEEVVNVVGESRPLGFDSDSASASESNQ